MKKAIINSEKGEMTVEFYDKDAPNTVANFIKPWKKILQWINFSQGYT